MNGAYYQVFGLKTLARVARIPDIAVAPLYNARRGFFLHLPWREGALGANPSFRRAFAARSLLPSRNAGGGRHAPDSAGYVAGQSADDGRHFFDTR
jgi:hypothetical protein